jgi:predicted dehydrogenase
VARRGHRRHGPGTHRLATPSTLDFTTKLAPNTWFQPRWKEVWFPDAFEGTMGQLLDSLATGAEPAISGRDNLHTMALVDACYRSLDEHRPVALNEVLDLTEPRP